MLKSGSVPNARLLVVAGVAQYVVSMAILLTASFYGENLPMWVKITDVGLVFTLTITSFFIHRAVSTANNDRALPVSYAIMTYLPIAAILLMWWFRDQLIWNILLPGLAWRTWMLFYNLPSVIKAWQK